MAKAGRKPGGVTRKDRQMQEIEAKALEIKREEAEKKRQKYQYELNNDYVAYPREIQLHALMGELSKTLGDTSEYLKHYQEIIKIVAENKGKKFWGMNGDAGKLVARCYEEAHFALAPFFFHYFLVCMEWDYDPSMKFYANRFCVMKDWAQELQKLEDGEYDILGLSAPPRTGKSGIETLFMLWTAGRHPDKSILFATHTNAMATKVHQDFYNMATDPKRQYSRIFPDIQINSNSEYLWIDFTPKASSNPYKTAYFRGIDGSFAGVLEASNVIVVDDLIKNIEEAMNPARLATANQKYTVDIEQRRTDDSVKELHVATRWSVHDVLSTLEADNAENPRAKFIAVPGLDENGESNFNFPYRPMTKEHFEHLREKMDDVSFECIIQQKPIERDGLVFTQDSLSYYEGILPDEEPDEVVFWADIAFGGGDYLSMPIGYVYGNDVYIHDVVHTNKTKNETIPLVVDAIIRNNVTRGGGEANNGGDAYMADVTEELKKKHYRCLITNQKAPTTKNKLSRILETQVEIKALATDGKSFRLHFLSDNAAKGNEMYKLYMKHLRNFNQSAKFIGRQKDDAADATAGLVTNILNRKNLGGIVTLSRKWLSI